MSLDITVMIVGMCTVFLILGLVYLTGFLVIKFSNKYHRENDNSLPAKEIAILTAAVHVLTEGKGVIKTVNKI